MTNSDQQLKTKDEIVKTLQENPEVEKTSLNGDWIMEVYFKFRGDEIAVVAEKQPQPELNGGRDSARWCLTVSHGGLNQIFRNKRSLDVVGRESALKSISEILEQTPHYEELGGFCPDCQEPHPVRPDLGLVADHAKRDNTPQEDLESFREGESFVCGLCVKKARETLNRFDRQSGEIQMFGGWK